MFVDFKLQQTKLIMVLVSLTQLVGTIYNICKVRDSNRGHNKKKNQTNYDYPFQ